MTTWKEQREWLEQLQSPRMFNISKHTQECIAAALARLDRAVDVVEAARREDEAEVRLTVAEYDALCAAQDRSK